MFSRLKLNGLAQNCCIFEGEQLQCCLPLTTFKVELYLRFTTFRKLHRNNLKAAVPVCCGSRPIIYLPVAIENDRDG